MILFKYLLDISDLTIEFLVWILIKVHGFTQRPETWELRSAEQLTLHSLHRWVLMRGMLCLVRKPHAHCRERIAKVQFALIAKVEFVCYTREIEITGCSKAGPHYTYPCPLNINVNLFHFFAVMQLWKECSKFNRITTKKQSSPVLFRHPLGVTQLQKNSAWFPRVNNLTILCFSLPRQKLFPFHYIHLLQMLTFDFSWE